MTDPVQALADWISKEPEATEVIIIRRCGGDFHVKIEYGDRSTVPSVAADLAKALTEATERANRLPSSARYYGERGTTAPSVSKPRSVTMMPGMG